MGIDFGERRIGVAVTDEGNRIAQPLETLESGARATSPFLRLEEIIRDYQVDEIVLGLPLNMDGSAGAQAQRTQSFGRELSKRFGVEVAYLDERWTTREADRSVEAAGSSSRRQKRRREKLDAVAATLILSTYLERRKSGSSGEPA